MIVAQPAGEGVAVDVECLQTGQRVPVVGDRRRLGHARAGDVDAEFARGGDSRIVEPAEREREAGDRSAGEFLNASVPAVDLLTLTTRRQVRQ